ncbi:MFS transporter [Domibacillus robiginosus]|uniref:MFS transporter n=1 Tax=Domibacillus robiginosus TaxID=1071054 RepID=UPI00067B3E60|nr:glycoside-pentoside-hexuronide (GPH):cation symporter [Domibacillus robiginosus]
MAASKIHSNLEGFEKIKFREKFSYGLGFFGLNSIQGMIMYFLIFFYTDIAGLPASVAGTLVFVSRLIDGALTPFIGYKLDNTHTKWGKFRPYLLYGAFPLGILFILTFTNPELGQTGHMIFIFTTYLLLSTLISVIGIPLTGLNTMITADPKQRASLTAFMLVFTSLGLLLASQLTTVIDFFENPATGFFVTAISIGILAIFFIWLCFHNTKERVVPQQEAEKITLKEMLFAIARNRALLIITLIMFLISIILNVRLGALIYYFTYNLNAVALFAVFNLVYTLITVFIQFGIGETLTKIGKVRMYNISAIVCSVGFLGAFLIGGSNITLALVFTTIGNIGMDLLFLCIWAMVPDTVDYGEQTTGRRSEGTIYSIQALSGKVAAALAGALLGWLLATSGYNPNGEQTKQALDGIMHITNTIPLVLTVITFGVMFLYPRNNSIQEQLTDDELTKPFIENGHSNKVQ